MKILVVGVTWPPETFIERLLKGLSANGHEITVCSKTQPGELKWVRPSFLKFHEIKKWDAIYFPWNSAAIEHPELFDRGVPVVISCRGAQVNVAPHNPERKMEEGLRKTFQKAARIHCVSEAILREGVQYGLDPRNAAVITPAVDTGFFQPMESRKNNEEFKIISTGSFIWRKGHEYALMAVRKLVETGIPVRFTMIGEGPERQRILYTIQDLDLSKHVILKGKLQPSEVRDQLQASDVFLFSSLSEGISNAVLEAMACGLPIVTTDAGGMKEAVDDGIEGFVVQVRDSDAMARALVKIFEDKKKSEKMGMAARMRTERDFNIGIQIRKFAKLFGEAVESGK